MVLELHVWGPAFGLPSLDPECLAAIAYFTQALDRSEWTVVHSSPSAVPTRRLPTLHNPRTATWTAGLDAIASRLVAAHHRSFRDPDARLTAAQRGRATALAALLRADAAPLLALSLHAGAANWAAATRPAYAAALPFPLAWTEAPGARRGWVALAAAAGVDGLVDGDEEGEEGVEAVPGRGTGQRSAAEQRARAANAKKLDGLVDAVMDVLVEQKGEGRWFFSSSSSSSSGAEAEAAPGPTTLDCLAFGYLALAVCPDLPRPWLRDALAARHPALHAFVGDMTVVCLGAAAVPTAPPRHGSALGVAGRFADGAVRGVPGIGEEWGRWRDGRMSVADLLAVVAGSLAAAALAAAYVLHRRRGGGGAAWLLPVLGAPVHRWEVPRRGLAGFGAAGALFGGLFSPEVRFGGVGVGGGGGGGGGIQTEFESPGHGKVDGVEVDVNVDVD